MQVTHDYHGVPLWLMKEYLVDLGAVEVERAAVTDGPEESVMVAPDWSAVVRKAVPNHVGSLVIGGANVEFSGEEEALDAMFERLHWKTMRGGG